MVSVSQPDLLGNLSSIHWVRSEDQKGLLFTNNPGFDNQHS
jgi:hypothetical protein